MYFIQKVPGLIGCTVKRAVVGLLSDWISAMFITIFFVAWVLKAFNKANFDLGALQTMFVYVKGAHLFYHGINSKYNSAQDCMPGSENETRGPKGSA